MKGLGPRRANGTTLIRRPTSITATGLVLSDKYLHKGGGSIAKEADQCQGSAQRM